MSMGVLAFLAAVVWAVLRAAAESMYKAVFALIIEGVAEAQERWGDGAGGVKREFVMEKVMGYVEEHANLSWLQRRLVELFVRNIIDKLVDLIKEQYGDDWTEAVREAKDYFRGQLAFLDG